MSVHRVMGSTPPIMSTKIPLSDRFQVMEKQHQMQRQLAMAKAKAVQVNRMSSAMMNEQVMFEQQLVALQRAHRLKILQEQELRIGDMRIIGTRDVKGRVGGGGTSLSLGINNFNTEVIRNRSKASSSSAIGTIANLRLRLGLGNPQNTQNLNNKNGSTLRQVQRNRDRSIYRNRNRTFCGGSKSKLSSKDNNLEMKSGGTEFNDDGMDMQSKDYLDEELDSYMSKRPQSRVNLDKELDEYMAEAAAARKLKVENQMSAMSE